MLADRAGEGMRPPRGGYRDRSCRGWQAERHPDRDVVEVRGEVADVLTRFGERRLVAGREDLVLVDRPDKRLVEVRVLE